MYNREQKEELDNLSLMVFGSRSKWRKMVEKGVAELQMEDTTRLNHDGTKEVVKTEKLYEGPNGGTLPHSVLKRYTPEEAKAYMLDLKAKRDNFLEMLKKQQEDAQKKKDEDRAMQETQRAVEIASGSSIKI